MSQSQLQLSPIAIIYNHLSKCERACEGGGNRVEYVSRPIGMLEYVVHLQLPLTQIDQLGAYAGF